MSRSVAQLDAARDALIAWLRSRGGAWLTTSDHALARAAGLTDADAGMRLLDLLAAEGMVEIERGSLQRSFRFVGSEPERAAATRTLVAVADRALTAPPQPPVHWRAAGRCSTHSTPIAPQPPVREKEVRVLDNHETRNHGMTYTVPKSEVAAIKAAAASAGLSISAFTARAVLASVETHADDTLRPAIASAVEAARAEGCDITTLLSEVIEVGLTLRRMARPGATA